MEIRASTITYSKKKRRETKQREIELQNEINKLDRKICNDNCLDTNTLNKYEEAKKQLKDSYDMKT